jgi:hypothetical protein
MKRELAILSAFLLLSVTACSQPGPAPGPGPGMMGGYGMGPGMMGGGYGPRAAQADVRELAGSPQAHGRTADAATARANAPQLGRPLGQERTDVG